MDTLHFWGKPGCQTNARQQSALRAEGFRLEFHDLLQEPWTEMRLLDFFMDIPVTDWFNPYAPKIKAGLIIPGMFDTTSALRAMMHEPLLIRRPLMEIGRTRVVGFDMDRIRTAFGSNLPEVPGTSFMQKDLRSSPH